MDESPEDELGFEPDEIGDWSERKIRIVSDYAKPFAQIMAKRRFKSIYIDGFSGGGIHIKKDTGERVLSTARRILSVTPPFGAYYFVDFDESKVEAMKKACADRENAFVICGDANTVLPEIVFPKVRWDEFERGLCFLDPYRILLSWDVILAAARQKTLELFIHFPTMDVQRNALCLDRSKVRPSDRDRMTKMWGDQTWEKHAFAQTPGLFGPIETKLPIDKLLEAFCNRLREIAKFKFVSKAVPMYTPGNLLVYHLIFASMNGTGLKIATDIFEAASRPPKNG
jgi:three-Cys-motif partner protein